MLTPAYTAPAVQNMPDIYQAVHEFVLQNALPPLTDADILRGWQNPELTPPSGDEYVVLSIKDTIRHGTNIESFIPRNAIPAEPEDYFTATHYETSVQLDFVSAADQGRQRTVTLGGLLRSGFGWSFFKPFNLSVVELTNPEDVAKNDRFNPDLQQTKATLRLLYWVTAKMGTAWFDEVQLNHPVGKTRLYKP